MMQLMRTAVLIAVCELSILAFHDASSRGPDITSYAAYAQSLAFDGDLLFINEFNAWHKPVFITPTGYASALGNIGVAYFWAPFLAAAATLLAVANQLAPGSPLLSGIEPLGPSEYYLHALSFANELFGLLAVVISYYFIRRYAARTSTLLALLFVALASPFFYFVTYFAPNPSIPSALLVLLFVMTWDHLRGHLSMTHWFLLGAIGGVLFTLASYNASVYCFPLLSLTANMRRTGNVRSSIRSAVCLGLGSLLGASPQLLTWQILFGRPGSPYSDNLDWLHPYILEVLFSSYHGLYFYAPFLLLATFGLVYLAKKDRLFALCALATLAVHTYICATTLAWWAGGSFGMRFLLPLTPLFMLGAALLFELRPRRWVVLVSVACLCWTYLLFLGVFSQQVEWADFYTVREQWDNVLRIVSELPRPALIHLFAIKSAATPLLLLPFTILFGLALASVRGLWRRGSLFANPRLGLLLGASPALMLLLTFHAGAVGSERLQVYQLRADYQAYPRGVGDPWDLSYTLSERGRYEFRIGESHAADADFRRAVELYARNSWVQMRVSDLELLPHRLEWQFANGVRLAGYSVAEEPLQESGVMQVALYWAIDRDAPAAFEIQLQLSDVTGRIMGERVFTPLQGQLPVSDWTRRDIYREIYSVPYSASGADRANIRLALLDALTNGPWPIAGEPAAQPRTIVTVLINR